LNQESNPHITLSELIFKAGEVYALEFMVTLQPAIFKKLPKHIVSFKKLSNGIYPEGRFSTRTRESTTNFKK